MAASMIFNAAVVGQGSAAKAAASDTVAKACLALMPGYQHDKATVAEMREYAGCIERLHPLPTPGSDLSMAKAAVVIMFAAIALGIAWERKHHALSDSWPGAIIGGSLIGLFFGIVGLLAIGGLWVGIHILLA